MLPTPPAGAPCANYARILHQAISQPCIMQLWVRVPLSARAAADEEEDGDREGQEAGGGGVGTDGEGEGMEEEDDEGGERPLRGAPPPSTRGAPPPSTAAASAREDPWETWNRLRTLCEFNASLGVVLGTFVCVCQWGVNGFPSR